MFEIALFGHVLCYLVILGHFAWVLRCFGTTVMRCPVVSCVVEVEFLEKSQGGSLCMFFFFSTVNFKMTVKLKCDSDLLTPWGVQQLMVKKALA